MQKQNFNKLRLILKDKGTLPIDELADKIGDTPYKTKLLLLNYLYSEISTLHPESDEKKYKYLYKIFKYFDSSSSDREQDAIVTSLQKSLRLCHRRLNKLYKENKLDEKDLDILYKLSDIIGVTLINIEYKETNKELTANEVSYELLSYLIYEVRNYNYLFELLKLFPKNLVIKNNDGAYLIDELIMKYINIVKNNNSNADIIYYEKIIKLFISDPKFSIEAGLEKTLLQKLENELDSITTNPDEYKDKDKFQFFIKEAISDIKNEEDKEKDISHINFKYDVSSDFSKDVLDEANKTITVNNNQVLDCRDKYTVTVDNNATKIFDDACSLEKLDNGNYLLGIYVADATIAVPKGGIIDLDARKRAESIYNGGKLVSTMLPMNVTDALTLKENVDRNAFGYFFELDSNTNCVNFSVRRCLISVDNNYSYDKVNEMLTDSKNIEEIKNMKNMYYISSKFHQNSSIRMQYRTLKKLKKAIKDNVTPNDVQTNIAATMIAEFMGQTNAFVADYFNKHPEIPFIYRINLSSYGEDIINKVKDISGSNISFDDLLNYINYICPPSIYSTVNLGHNGLNLSAYCHATNPLRNYSSLEIERIIIDHMLHDDKDIDLVAKKRELDKTCSYMNNRISLNNDYVEEVKQYVKKSFPE